MQKKKSLFYLRRLIAGVLALCMFLPDFIVPPIKASAAPAKDMIYITPEQRHGEIKNNGFEVTTYDYFENGNLVITNLYYYKENITQTYHTINTIWSKYKTGEGGRGTYCHPKETGTKGVDWIESGVRAEDIESSAIKKTTKSTFTYTNENIQRMLTALYGDLQPDTDYVVYISEIFCLKTRKYNKDGSIDFAGSIIKEHPQYDYLEAIQNAAKWTDSTKEGFEAYYDIPITFRLSGGNINVVCVDMDMHNAELKRGSEKAIIGKTTNIKARVS